jgi:hypothetical protein
MTELVKSLTELSNHSASVDAANLLRRYSFELEEYTVDQLLSYWQETYQINWIRLAIVEALYLGRYKAVSIEQILVLWKRRGQPIYHFNHEFEHLVCDKIPRNLLSPNEPTPTWNATFPQKEVLSKPGTVSSSSQESVQQLLSPLSSHNDSPKETTHNYYRQTDSGENVPHPSVSSLGETETAPVASQADEREQGEKEIEDINGKLGAKNLLTLVAASIDRLSPTSPSIAAALPNETCQTEDTLASSNEIDQSQPDSVQKTKLTPPTAAAIASSLNTNGQASQQLSVLLSTIESVLPGLGMNAPNLKPKLKLQLTTHYQPKWLIGVSKHPIHQFTPESETSDFHDKLRAVVEPTEGSSS